MCIDAFVSALGLNHAASEPSDGGDVERYTDRICSADETYARVAPLLLRYGITRVSRLTGLDTVGIPVWAAIRPNSLSLAVNQGKGIGDADARISAVMEGLERAVAGEPEALSHLASLTGLRRQGLDTEPASELLARGQPLPGDDDELHWLQGYDLLGGRTVWLPRDALLLDRTVETRFWQSSDGLASGNSPLEATFHGLLERVERDAELLWSFARTTERAERCVDPFAFGDGVIDALMKRIHRAGLVLQLFDITSDIGIPCFQALIGPADIAARKAVLYAEAANGCGCHPVPVRAVIRAITEAAQSRLTLVSGARDDIAPETYSRPMPKGLIEDFGHSARRPAVYVRELDRRPLARKLADILDALRRASIRSAIAVPLNGPDAAFSVVKVVVLDLENPPGDRHRRFGARALRRMMRRP